jgi:ABC-type nitrate/sulfonate/bicarbonate transport system substrate-binding protein
VDSVLAFRSSGMPLTVVATVGDRNPSCVYFLASRGIPDPKDLSGKRIAVDPFDEQAMLFPLFARRGAIRDQDIAFLRMNLPERILALSTGAVDAIFGTLQQNQALAAAIGPERLGRLLWADFGFDIYGACLFVRQDALKSKAGALASFMAAALKAWELALRTPDDAVAALGMYRAISHADAGRLAEELADLKALFDTPTYRTQGVGYIDAARMSATADAVTELEGVTLRFKASDAMTLSLLPKPPIRMPVQKPPAAAVSSSGGAAAGAPSSGGTPAQKTPAAGAP